MLADTPSALGGNDAVYTTYRRMRHHRVDQQSIPRLSMDADGFNLGPFWSREEHRSDAFVTKTFIDAGRCLAPSLPLCSRKEAQGAVSGVSGIERDPEHGRSRIPVPGPSNKSLYRMSVS